MKVGGITLRELDAKTITENVAQMCKEAAYYLPEDVYQALKKGRETEKSPAGQNVLDQIIKNAEIAKAEDRPYCQDTGMTIVFLELGQDLHIVGGDLEQAVNDGTVVSEPLFNRVNTQNNTPGVIYTKIVPGDKLKITVEPKGFGSENKGGVKMLVPADGVEGVKKAVMDIILHASMNPCPPTVIGVGIGGTMDKACLYSKVALTRSVDSHNPMPEYAKLEDELLDLINQTGIGPQLGGSTTCLGVNIEWGPTHIAGLPVAVTICCHACRHKTRTL